MHSSVSQTTQKQEDIFTPPVRWHPVRFTQQKCKDTTVHCHSVGLGSEGQWLRYGLFAFELAIWAHLPEAVVRLIVRPSKTRTVSLATLKEHTAVIPVPNTNVTIYIQ